MLRALIAALRRFFSRRAARRLLASNLPRGVREIRLAALKPRHFRLDAQFRPPPALDGHAPLPPRPLRLLPRTPLARRPIHRLDQLELRLDRRSQARANEGLVPLLSAAPKYTFLRAPFRRRFLDLPWMARDRIAFLGPMRSEWFLLWWEKSVAERLGPGEPEEWERPDEVDWAMDVCKEQMLIRRDVPKHEQAPPPSPATAPSLEHPLAAWDPVPLPDLVPPKEWVEPADPRSLAPKVPSAHDAPRDAYLRWRTLMDSLQDR